MKNYSSRLPAIAGLLLGFLSPLLFSDTLRAQTLTHGPIAGGVTSSEANIFVRTSAVATVSVRYGTQPDLSTFQTSASFTTSSANDFTKIIPLTNLTPETPYYLNVVVNGVAQNTAPFPTFTTFAPTGVGRDFKFVVLSDFVNVKNLTATSQTFASAAAESPAFVFIGGDFDHRNPANIIQKRMMFQELYDPATPFMSDFGTTILRQFAIAHQWDDHDAGWNNIDKTYANWATSQQVYQEYVPSYPLPGIVPGIWQEFHYAQADFFILDCRSQRDVETDPDDANKSMLDGNALGATGELAWLKQGLLTSTATWKVIFTSVITNPSTKVPDGWGGYQTEWNALRDFINSNHITNVVFLSGDLHLAAIDNGTASGFPEMCMPEANVTGERSHCSTDAQGTWSEGYYQDTCAGFGLVTILQNPDRLILQSADEFGTPHISLTVASAQPTPTPTPTPGSPVITKQPVNKTVNVGATTKFTVKATGDSPLHHQWHKNGMDISGATKTTYTTPPATGGDDGAVFSDTVHNAVGSVTSHDATLTVKTPPTITTQPVDKSVKVGATPKFTVTASGTTPFTYQWRKNSTDISGATKKTYTTPPVTEADNGSVFSVVVTNSAGNATSDNATLTVK